MPKKKTRRGGGSAAATATTDSASSTGAVSRPAKQRPNDACACGSGKKHKKCCALKDPLDSVLARHEAAKCLLDAGDARGAAKEWANLLEPARLVGNRRAQVAVLNGLGLAYHSLDEHGHALTCYEESLAICREGWTSYGFRPDGKAESDCLFNLGTTYNSLGNHRKAIAYLEQGLNISKQMGDRVGEWNALGGLATAYSSAGDHRKSIEFHDKGLVICRELEDLPAEAVCLHGLALAYFSIGDYSQAATHHEESLKAWRGLGDRQGEGNALGNLGLSYIHLGEYKKAIAIHEEALAVHRETGDPHSEGSCLNNLGVCCIRSGDAPAALSHYCAAVDVFTEHLTSGLTRSPRAVIVADKLTALDGIIDSLIAIGRTEDALRAAEETRAFELSEELFKLPFPENPATNEWTLGHTRALAEELGAELVYYNHNKLHRKLRTWVVPRRSDAASQVFFTELSLGGDELDTIFQAFSQWHCSRSIATAGSRANESSLSTSDALARLYELLIRPIADVLTPNGRVVFCPHRELLLVPFAALRYIDSASNAVRHLIDDYTVHVGVSMRALDGAQDRAQYQPDSPAPGANVLVVGYPDCPQQVLLPLARIEEHTQTLKGWRKAEAPALPAATAEAKWVQRVLGCKALLGPEATRTAVLKNMRDASVIHFATHGFVDGLGARLLLHGTVSESEDCDQWLRPQDILGCGQLSAQVAILSACNSGPGAMAYQMAKGFGVVGLARALLAMGVPTVVVALWELPDSEASGIVRHLYERLTQCGLIQVGTALRAATFAWMRELNKPREEISEQLWGGWLVLGTGSVWLKLNVESETEGEAASKCAADIGPDSEPQLESTGAAPEECLIVSALTAATAFGSIYVRSLERSGEEQSSPERQFQAGDRVECKVADQWHLGTVRGLNFDANALGCPAFGLVPYVVELDTEQVACVPRDDDTVVRKA